MVIRIIGLFVLLSGIGAILVADKTLARSGSGFAARPIATPPAAIHPAGPQSVIHHGRGAIGHGAHAFRTHSFRHRRLGFGGPGWWSTWPWYDPPYPAYDSALGPTSDFAPDDVPPPGPGFPAMGYRTPYSAPASVYVMPYRPGCDSQTQTLPGRGGEERSVTIVRC